MAASSEARVTIHMAASLDGYVARKDGSVDWMATDDTFPPGADLAPADVEAFLGSIDCYVLGSRTYESALRFEAQGLGWAYGATRTIVLTSRTLPRLRESVEFRSGDLARLVNDELRPRHRRIWFGGGPQVATACLRQGLADEVSLSVLPVVLGDGIPFFGKLSDAVALHLAEVKPYRTGIVELRYEVRRSAGADGTAS